MSSPGDQLASIETLPPVYHQPSTAQKTDRLAAQQPAADDQQSAIAKQAEEDAKLLNDQASLKANTLNAQAATLEAAARKRQLATELARTNSLLARQHVAATKTSIFASANTATVETVAVPQQVALNQTDHGVEPGQTLNAAQNSIYSGETDQPSRDTAAIPLPDAQQVSQVQDLALAGKTVPADDEVASADNAANDVSAAMEDMTPSTQPKTRSLEAMPSYDKAVADVQSEKPAAEPRKKRLTLADFFRRTQPRELAAASFDGDRFGNKRRINTQSIPNMQTASLNDQALPGVTTTAMMPTNNVTQDEMEDSGDDQPAGLMKLASLPGMTRMAPNGLWVQNPTVDVSCFGPQLKDMLQKVELHYGRHVVVTSGYRDPGHNRRVGGAQHSMHTLCAAADIQVEGVSKWELADYLRSIPGRGGVGTYCYTESVHIDLGDERDWNWRCRRRRHG